MKTTILNILLQMAVIFLTCFSSCNSETSELISKSKEHAMKNYFISLRGEYDKDSFVETRAHWEENSKNIPLFYWDFSDDEMKAFIFRKTSAVTYMTGNICSGVKVLPKEDRLKCSLQITDGLSEAYQDGDVVWAVSPISDVNIEGSSVKFTLPEYYEYRCGQEVLTSHLSDYILLSGVGEVQNENALINFRIHPAIFRFKIINSDTENLILNSISFSGPFNNEAYLVYDGRENVTFGRSSVTQTYSIKINIREGLIIGPTESKYLYALVMPTDLTNQEVVFSIESNFCNKSQVITYDKVFSGKENAPDTGFKSNTYKTLNVTLKRNSVQLAGSTINEFVFGKNFDISMLYD